MAAEEYGELLDQSARGDQYQAGAVQFAGLSSSSPKWTGAAVIFWDCLRLLAQIEGGRIQAPAIVVLGTLLLVLVTVRTMPPTQNGAIEPSGSREPSETGRKGVVSYHWWGALLVLLVLYF